MIFNKLYSLTSGNCVGCEICDGEVCAGSLPGFGGVDGGKNFKANYKSWCEIDVKNLGDLPKIGIGPVTGAEQNIGYHSEKEFYKRYLGSAITANVELSIGDGFPNYKLEYGIEALKYFNRKATVILKPYLNSELVKRIKLVEPVAEIIGVDIDSYRIVTMENQVKMQKKSAEDLIELKSLSNKPFLIKGICDEEGVELISKVRPDIVVVSNHGGRVIAPNIGSAYLLEKYAPLLKKYVKEVWVDGGLRTKTHLQKAKVLGADRVLIARPFIQASLEYGDKGIATILKENYGL